MSEWFERIKSVYIENETGERTQPWGQPIWLYITVYVYDAVYHCLITLHSVGVCV